MDLTQTKREPGSLTNTQTRKKQTQLSQMASLCGYEVEWVRMGEKNVQTNTQLFVSWGIK